MKHNARGNSIDKISGKGLTGTAGAAGEGLKKKICIIFSQEEKNRWWNVFFPMRGGRVERGEATGGRRSFQAWVSKIRKRGKNQHEI